MDEQDIRILMDEKREQMMADIKSARFMDDDFFRMCFSGGDSTDNLDVMELILRIILNMSDLIVNKIVSQYDMKNIRGKSVVLDAYATDSKGKRYIVEVQKDSRGAGRKRARYRSSLADCDALPEGYDEEEHLVDTYVIFITEHDVLGGDKPIYHIDRYIKETKEAFNDGEHIVYVNAAYKDKDGTDLGKLMHDFKCVDPDKMNFEVLSRTAANMKGEGGKIKVNEILEDFKKKMYDICVRTDRQELAYNAMKLGGYSREQLIELFRLTPDDYNAVLKEYNDDRLQAVA